MELSRNCQNCKKDFIRILSPSNLKAGKGKFCSKECCRVGTLHPTPWNKGKKMSEAYCKKVSDVQRGKKRKPLSEETRKKIGAANRKPIYFNCDFCGKQGIDSPQKFSLSKNHFCAVGCYANFLKGRKLPEAQKRKMSEKMKEDYRTGKRISYMKGKSHSLETRKKQSEKMKGEKSHLWRGGIYKKNYPLYRVIRKSPEYKFWKVSVFLRDNRTCIWCGYTGQKIEADHIKPFSKYPELRFVISNGRTLCHDCHRKTDTYGHKSIQNYEPNFINNSNKLRTLL